MIKFEKMLIILTYTNILKFVSVLKKRGMSLDINYGMLFFRTERKI